MKIDRTQIKGPAEAYKVNSARPANKAAATEGTQAVSKPDSLDISEKAKEATALKAKLRQAPEVRHDLVNKIKAQVEAGTYSVDPKQVAEKLLKSKVLE